MSKLEAFLRKHQATILLLLLAGGFAVVLGELVLYQHWDGTQLVGFVSTVVGMLVVFVGIFLKGTLRVVAALLLLVLSLAGLIGTYEHFEEGGGEAARPQPALVQRSAGVVQQVSFSASTVERAPAQDNDEDSERRPGGETEPPPLAPLSLSGLALMGAVILLAKQDEQKA